MVGNDPRSGHPSTMKTLIIPLKMHFTAGNQPVGQLDDIGYAGYRATALNHTFDGTRRVGDVLDSPIFSNSNYPSDMGGDNTQYGDAFMRAQFGQIRSGYHVGSRTSASRPRRRSMSRRRSAWPTSGRSASGGPLTACRPTRSPASPTSAGSPTTSSA